MEQKWWKEAVVYQVYPISYYDTNSDGIGDLRGITQKLDYIKALGVDVIWLNPIYKSPNADNGYDIADYYQISQLYGTMEDFENLLSEMHQRDLKLVMDLVVNHTSDEHAWFMESKKSCQNAYRDYYIWQDGKIDCNGNRIPPNNWTSFFGGPAWKFDPDTNQYYLHLFHEKQPDLNWTNKEVRDKIYEMMRWWFDKGIDGFRMDVINLISKKPGFPDGFIDDKTYVVGKEHCVNGPQFHAWLQEMNREVLSRYDCMSVGECIEITPDEGIKTVAAKRNELDTLFHFEHMRLDSEGSKWNIIELDLPALKEVIHNWYQVIKNGGWTSNYLNNHDQPRAVSRFGNDQAHRVTSAKMLAAFNLLLPGTPYIYQGEEIGMTNAVFTDIDQFNDFDSINWYHLEHKKGKTKEELLAVLNYISRDHSRTPMQWNAGLNSGFTDGEPWLKLNANYASINVEQALKDENSIYYYYQKVIELRKKHKTLIYGQYEMLLKESRSLFAFRRFDEQADFLIILNFTADEETIPLDLAGYEAVIANYPDHSCPGSVKPYEARILKRIHD